MDQRMLAKKTQNIQQRLEAVEGALGGISEAVNQNLGQVSDQLRYTSEVLEALVQLVGKDAVEKFMNDSRLAKAEAQSAAEKAALAELLSQGSVVAAEKISKTSLIVGHETNADGTVRPPGRAQVPFSRVEPGFQPGLLDKGVGFALDLPAGAKFIVDEIYEVVEKPAEKTEPSVTP